MRPKIFRAFLQMEEMWGDHEREGVRRTPRYLKDILVVTLLHNIVGSVICRYLGHYFAAQYCRLGTMYIFLS